MSKVIKIIGVGMAGCSAVSHIHRWHDNIIQLYAIDSCVNSMSSIDSIAPDFWVNGENLLRIGVETTGGLGAACDVEKGCDAACESLDEIEKIVQGADIVILTAGLGGGIGSGTTEVIANLCRECGIKTIGVFTLPFDFESQDRITNASERLSRIARYLDYVKVLKCEDIMAKRTGFPPLHWEDVWDYINRKRAENILIMLMDTIKVLMDKENNEIAVNLQNELIKAFCNYYDILLDNAYIKTYLQVQETWAGIDRYFDSIMNTHIANNQGKINTYTVQDKDFDIQKQRVDELQSLNFKTFICGKNIYAYTHIDGPSEQLGKYLLLKILDKHHYESADWNWRTKEFHTSYNLEWNEDSILFQIKASIYAAEKFRS